MTNPDDPAFSPHQAKYNACPGLTKREYFAAMAMQGFAASVALHNGTESTKAAVKWADALIAELNKEAK